MSTHKLEKVVKPIRDCVYMGHPCEARGPAPGIVHQDGVRKELLPCKEVETSSVVFRWKYYYNFDLIFLYEIQIRLYLVFFRVKLQYYNPRLIKS